MRTVKINRCVQKASDTSHTIVLELFEDEQPYIIPEDRIAVVFILNQTGLIGRVDPEAIENKVSFESDELENYPPGIYYLEVRLVGRTRIIFPDDGYVKFKLSENATTVRAGKVNTITLEMLKDELKKDMTEASAGKSAYELAVQEGFQGTLSDWLRALKGDQGPAGEHGPAGRDGQVGKSAYQIWLDLGNTGSEKDFIDSLKSSDGGTNVGVRHAPTGWTLDRSTTPWTIWLDNGCGLQFPEYATTATVYGYGFESNLNSGDFISWPLIPNVIRASRGAITIDKFKKQNGGFDYWSPSTKVIDPVQDASKFDWNNAFGDAGTNSGSYGRKPNFARAMYELGIWTDDDVIGVGAVRKEG